MRRRLPVVAMLAATLSIAAPSVAACGGSGTSSGSATGGTTTSSAPTVTTTSGSATSGDASVAWVDKVCGEMLKVTETQITPPPNLSSSDPAQALKAFDQYVNANINVVDQTITNLRNVGPSPIAGADQALTQLVNGLESVKKGYQATRDAFAKVNPNDPQAAQAAMMQALSGLSQGGEELSRALNSIDSNPAIKEAGKKAPNCQKLDTGSSSTTTTTS
ncbi:MAG TPA: hypothetical protein VGJ95_17705 [Pseudonocardiaceae bacterium]